MSDTARPKTPEELAALPVGPEIGKRTISITKEDRERGYVVDGKRKIAISGSVSSISIPVMPAVLSEYIGPEDVLAFVHEGESWSIGRYSDGRYFRRRLPL